MPDHTDRKLEIVTEIPESAMVVFAHPDDAEIGSGGVIARWVAAGCDVTYVLSTPARLTEYKCAGGHRVDSTLDFFFTNPCLTSQASSVYAAQ